MNAELWFSTPVWYEDLTNIDNKQIKKYCKTISSKHKGRVLSNYGGWQSSDFNLNSFQHQELNALSNIIDQKIKECARFLNVKTDKKISVDNLWININYTGNSNLIHTHPGSFLSGVYYVSTPTDCGRIVFQHPSEMIDFWWQSFTDGNTDITCSNINFEAKEGRLLIFPSWLKHYVQSNNSSKPRMSIAFNSCIT